ncbi:MAG: TerC family protein [Rhizobiales bacterium]|nr:TerC family protein [Hyphomicrobiales bacterium]
MDGGIFDPATITTMFAEFEHNLARPEYWLSVLKIIWIDILLSGDNALVIALACRNLPEQQRKLGMILGAGAAVALRVVFATIIVVLLTIPYLKLVGGLALLVIAAKLLVPDHEDEDVGAASNLWQAVRLIVVADVVMSLDNVIAIAAAADGSVSLLILGLIVSIPLIIAGAALIMAVLDRLPVLVWAGAALLGWIAGHVIATDIAVEPYLHHVFKGQLTLTLDASSALFGFVGKSVGSTDLGELVMSLIGVIVVLIVGAIWRRRKLRKITALKAT